MFLGFCHQMYDCRSSLLPHVRCEVPSRTTIILDMTGKGSCPKIMSFYRRRRLICVVTLTASVLLPLVLLYRNDFHMQVASSQYGDVFVPSPTQRSSSPSSPPPPPSAYATATPLRAALAFADSANGSNTAMESLAHAMLWRTSAPRGSIHVVSAHVFALRGEWTVALVAETSASSRAIRRGFCVFPTTAKGGAPGKTARSPIIVLESSERTDGSPFRVVVLRCAVAARWTGNRLALIASGERLDDVRVVVVAAEPSSSAPGLHKRAPRFRRTAACVPPIHRFGRAAGSVDALALIEWIEFHRLAGVDRIDIYVDEVPPGFAAVLGAYAAGAVRRVRPGLAAPFDVELYAFRGAAQWGHGFDRVPYGNNNLQLLAKHDCLYRHKAMGTTEWLWMGDLDEFLYMPSPPSASASAWRGWRPQLRAWARGTMRRSSSFGGGPALAVGSVTFGNFFFSQYCLSAKTAGSELRLVQRVVRRAQFWDQGEGGCVLRSCRGKAIVRPVAVALVHNHRVERFEAGQLFGELKASPATAHIKHLRDSVAKQRDSESGAGARSGTTSCHPSWALHGRTLHTLERERVSAKWSARWPDRFWHWHGTVESGELMFDTEVSDSMRPQLEHGVSSAVAAVAAHLRSKSVVT